MTNPISFDIFSSELLPGENIEWTGQPNPAVIFHPEDWGVIPFSLLWGGFALFWFLSASGIWGTLAKRPSQGFQSFGFLWGTPFVVVGQYMIWGRFFYDRWRKKRTYYALTNRRALIVQLGIGNRSATSAYFEQFSLVDKRVRRDGNGCISFGGPFRGRWQSGKNRPPRPTTFDDVDDADTVFQIAARLHEKARSSPGVTSSQWPS